MPICVKAECQAMLAYYNDNDPYVCAWLRNLMEQGLITPGTIDPRDIKDVKPHDLNGYTRCHFFAGIAGWDLALQLAGWPSDAPVWTGSCPCQPWSEAGKGLGNEDPRHVWPELYRLIRECHPGTVFGEQVEAAISRGWLDRVFADLEREGYACWASVLGHTASARRTSGNGYIGWPTPQASDCFGKSGRTRPESRQACLQRDLNRITRNTTGAGSALNPSMCRWLMRFPRTWDLASPNYAAWCEVQGLIKQGGFGPTATPSCRRWQQSSSRRQWKGSVR